MATQNPYELNPSSREKLGIIESYSKLRNAIVGQLQPATRHLQGLDAALEEFFASDTKSLATKVAALQPKYLPQPTPSAEESKPKERISYAALVEKYFAKHPRARRVDSNDIKAYIVRRLSEDARYSAGATVKVMESRGFKLKRGVFRK